MSGRPTVSSSSLALSRALALGTPAISMGKQMLSRQVRCMSRLNCWKIMLMERRFSRSALGERAVMSSPSMITWPEVGRSSRLMQRTSVDFPAPLMPTMPNISPSRMVRFTSSRAVNVPSGVGKVFCRC